MKPERPISATDAIPLAINHAKALLVHPFRLGFWARMAIVAFFAGEFSGGGFHFPASFYHPPNHRIGAGQYFAAHSAISLINLDWLRRAWLRPGLLHPEALPFLLLLIAAGVALLFIFLYIHSVFRFILFDSSLTGNCGIRAAWGRFHVPGQRYWLFLIAFMFISWSALLLLIGLPAFLAWRAGIFRNPEQHLPLLIIGGLALLFVVLCVFLILAIVGIAVKDFFVPLMALEGRTLGGAWRELQRILLPEK